jgi:hypothetical protein
LKQTENDPEWDLVQKNDREKWAKGRNGWPTAPFFWPFLCLDLSLYLAARQHKVSFTSHPSIFLLISHSISWGFVFSFIFE